MSAIARPDPNLKLIYHNGPVAPDDPTFPFKLDMNFRPPEFMSVAFMMIHGGSEQIVVRGEATQSL